MILWDGRDPGPHPTEEIERRVRWTAALALLALIALVVAAYIGGGS